MHGISQDVRILGCQMPGQVFRVQECSKLRAGILFLWAIVLVQLLKRSVLRLAWRLLVQIRGEVDDRSTSMTCSARSFKLALRVLARTLSAAGSAPRFTVPAIGCVIMREVRGSFCTSSSGEAPMMWKSVQWMKKR